MRKDSEWHMNTTGKEHIEVLKKLVNEAENGDEQGFKPDLTPAEVKALDWAVNKIEY